MGRGYHQISDWFVLGSPCDIDGGGSDGSCGYGGDSGDNMVVEVDMKAAKIIQGRKARVDFN